MILIRHWSQWNRRTELRQAFLAIALKFLLKTNETSYKTKNSFSKINPKNSHTTEFMKSVGLNDTILHRTEDQGPNAMHRNGVSWNWNVKIRRQRRYGFMSQLAGGVAISSNSLRWHLHKLCSVHLDASASLAQLRLDLSYTLVFSVSVVKQLNLQSDGLYHVLHKRSALYIPTRSRDLHV